MVDKVDRNGNSKLTGMAPLDEKILDGAVAGEFSMEEMDVLAIKAMRAHAKLVDAIVAKEDPTPKEIVKKNYGVFADSPALFLVDHEQVGPHRRGDKISYRDICQFETDKQSNGGYKPNYDKPLIYATKKRVDELIAAKAILPCTPSGVIVPAHMRTG